MSLLCFVNVKHNISLDQLLGSLMKWLEMTLGTMIGIVEATNINNKSYLHDSLKGTFLHNAQCFG